MSIEKNKKEPVFDPGLAFLQGVLITAIFHPIQLISKGLIDSPTVNPFYFFLGVWAFRIALNSFRTLRSNRSVKK